MKAEECYFFPTSREVLVQKKLVAFVKLTEVGEKQINKPHSVF